MWHTSFVRDISLLFKHADEWVTSQINESCHTYERHVTHTTELSHTRHVTHVSHVTHVNEFNYIAIRDDGSWHTALTHKWMRHCTLMDESRHTVLTCEWMSHGTHMNESCHTREWFHSHSHEDMNEPCVSVLTYECSHTWPRHVTHMAGHMSVHQFVCLFLVFFFWCDSMSNTVGWDSGKRGRRRKRRKRRKRKKKRRGTRRRRDKRGRRWSWAQAQQKWLAR